MLRELHEFDALYLSFFIKGIHNINESLPANKKVKMYPTDVIYVDGEPTEGKVHDMIMNMIQRDSLMGSFIIEKFNEMKNENPKQKALVIMNFRHAYKVKIPNADDNVGMFLAREYPGKVANVLINTYNTFAEDKALQDGKWDAAFKVVNKEDVGFDFRYSPFGDCHFDHFPFEKNIILYFKLNRNMFENFFKNLRKPEGVSGSIMLWIMSLGHSSNAKWGLDYLSIKPDDCILDVGCGSGTNIKRLLQSTNGNVYGIDYSALCVEKSKKNNEKAIAEKRCEIKESSVSEIPYDANMFDIVTAFETVYFWLDSKDSLKEILRILKSGGTFFICNELVREEGKEAPLKSVVNMLNAKIYSVNDYQNILSSAGFINIKVSLSKNKKMLCLTAQKV